MGVLSMSQLIGIAVVVIILLALANPRFWRDLKSGHSSMDDVLETGKEDLKIALRNRKKKRSETDSK